MDGVAEGIAGVGTGGQGSAASSGYGELKDGGGADGYSGVASYSVVADDEALVEPGAFTPFFEASVENGAAALLVDRGAGADSFKTGAGRRTRRGRYPG